MSYSEPSPLRIPSDTISFVKNSDLFTYFPSIPSLQPTYLKPRPIAPESRFRRLHIRVLDPVSLFATHHHHLRHSHLPNSHSDHGFSRFSTYHTIIQPYGAPQEAATRRPPSVRSKRWSNPGQQYSDSRSRWLYYAASQPFIGFKTSFYSTISKSIFCRAFKS